MNGPDPLAGLRDQIRAVSDAAERLVSDARAERGEPLRAHAAGGAAPQTPPAGWQQAKDANAPADLATLARLLEVLRQVLPAELQQQVTDLVRQLLILLRALIDWAVTRLEQEGHGGAVEVEDIPIH